MSETLEFGSGLAEPGLSNKVTFLLYFTPKWSSWAQSDPILHHLKQSMGAGIVFSSWGEVQTCLQTGNLKNFGLKRIFRAKPLCTGRLLRSPAFENNIRHRSIQRRPNRLWGE